MTLKLRLKNMNSEVGWSTFFLFQVASLFFAYKIFSIIGSFIDSREKSICDMCCIYLCPRYV